MDYEKRFDFITFSPTIQFLGKPVNISCIIYPCLDIITVTMIVTYPSREVIRLPMNDDMNGKNSYQLISEMRGKYWFFIEVETTESGIFQSGLYSFWISSLLEDKDGDGMLDTWEIRNGLDPNIPYDAFIDSDRDGYSNSEEFIMKTDSMRNDVVQNSFYQLKEKQFYFFISFLLCFILCFFHGMG